MKLYKSLVLVLLFILTTQAFPWGSELCQGCRIDSSALAGPIYTWPNSAMLQQMISTNGTFLFQDDVNLYPQYSNGIKLEIRTQNKAPLRLAYDTNNYVDFSVDAGGTLTVNATGSVVISQNGNVVISNGNVGIGTTSPGVKLEVTGTISANTVLVNGNVGIGTISPVVALDVNGGIKIGNVSDCTAEKAGTIRWSDLHFEGCTGTAWRQMAYSIIPPAIGSILPAFGPVSTVISISGTGFVSGAQVTIGGVTATNVNWVSATELTATTPANATSGAKDVTVTNPDNGSAVKSGGFTYSVYATGGTITTPTISGIVYRIHTFTNTGSDTLAVTTGGNVEYLVVAGGGGGGYAGGGGAGGYRSGTLGITTGTKTVIVGAGGSSTVANFSGNKGNNSSFDTVISEGGGFGGSLHSPYDGGAGGSGGGGGGYYGGAGGLGSAAQGYNGGYGASSIHSGGGGGGSEGAGTNGTNNSVAAAGGIGTQSTISGTAVTYAAGGIGSNYNYGLPPSRVNANETTGNGGQGGVINTDTAGNGGSGIVIVRYPISQ